MITDNAALYDEEDLETCQWCGEGYSRLHGQVTDSGDWQCFECAERLRDAPEDDRKEPRDTYVNDYEAAE